MRFLNLLPTLILAFLLLFIAAYQGVNTMLEHGDDGKKISAVINRYLPGVQFRYATARLRLGLGNALIRLEDAQLSGGNNTLSVPQADFWLRPGGGIVVLYAPEINLTHTGATLPAVPLPTVGEWQIEMRDATVRWHDKTAGMLLTLHNVGLLARLEQKQWRLQLDAEAKSRRLHALAHLQPTAAGVRGEVYAEFDNWPPAATLPGQWNATRTTVRAMIEGDKARWRAVGNWHPPSLNNTAPVVRWHAGGLWHRGGVTATVALAAENMLLAAAPQAPPVAAYISGVMQYDSATALWQWQSTKAIASGKDGTLRASGRLTGNGATVTDITATLRLIEVPAKSLSLYVPAGPMQQWFAESVTAAGMIENARIAWRGPPNAPSIALTAAFDDATIELAADWPPAQHLRGVITVADGDINISGTGMIAGMAGDVVVRMPDLAAERATLHLAAQFIRAPLTHYLAAAGQLPPTQTAIQTLTDDLSLSGEGKLSLSLSVPLATPENTAVRGKLAVHNVVAEVGAALPRARRLSGVVTIDNNGARGTLRGRFQKHPLTVKFNNRKVALHGSIDAAVALSLAALQTLSVTGTTPFVLRRDDRQTVILSPLTGAAILLPPPLAKAAAMTAALSVRLQAAQTEVQLQLDGNRFYVTHRGGTDIAINSEPQPPPAAGINFHGTIGEITGADAWLPLAAGAKADASAISLVITDSELLNMRHTVLRVVSPPPLNNTRRFMLSGDSIAGTVSYRPGNVRANLSRLLLRDLQTAGNLNVEMLHLTVAVTVEEFQMGGAGLGRLHIAGKPLAKEVWQLTRLQLQNGRNTLHMAGQYADHTTNLTLTLNAPDAAGLIQTFGWDNVISEGEIHLAGGINWPATPADFSLHNLRGRLQLQAEDLRYLKTDADIISLLAVFSPQSLFSLGFTEIGKEGVRLDTLGGEIYLADGNAVFQDITMTNEDINISLTGKTYLPDQTLALSGRVRPGNRLLNAGSVVSLGAGVAALHPISLAAGFLLGKVFEQPLSEIGAYNYTITGTWDDPKYTEVGTVVNPPKR